MAKICYIDVETTGTDPEKHALIQIACLVEIDGRVEGDLYLDIQPHEGAEFERAALAKHGLTREQMVQFTPMKEAHEELLEFFGKYVDKYDKKDKFFFVGYFASFDNNFLRRFFERVGDDYFGSWFFTPTIDVSVLLGYALMERRSEMPNFKLASVLKEMGIAYREDELHDALYDIRLTRKLLKYFERMQNA
jgi:DNA polymerase III subunit epsilon